MGHYLAGQGSDQSIPTDGHARHTVLIRADIGLGPYWARHTIVIDSGGQIVVCLVDHDRSARFQVIITAIRIDKDVGCSLIRGFLNESGLGQQFRGRQIYRIAPQDAIIKIDRRGKRAGNRESRAVMIRDGVVGAAEIHVFQMDATTVAGDDVVRAPAP